MCGWVSKIPNVSSCLVSLKLEKVEISRVARIQNEHKNILMEEEWNDMAATWHLDEVDYGDEEGQMELNGKHSPVCTHKCACFI